MVKKLIYLNKQEDLHILEVQMMMVLMILEWEQIIVFQCLHFVLYYQQPLDLSIIWSVVDWIVWFAIAHSFFYIHRLKKLQINLKNSLLFIVLAGPCQLLLASMIYQLIFNGERSVIDSFFHMLNKRWLQNLILALVFLLINLQFYRQSSRNINVYSSTAITIGKHGIKKLRREVYLI